MKRDILSSPTRSAETIPVTHPVIVQAAAGGERMSAYGWLQIRPELPHLGLSKPSDAIQNPLLKGGCRYQGTVIRSL